MARFYGLTPPRGLGFGVVRPTGDQKRFGLLTYPALLASLASGEETSPVARGILFVEKCCAPMCPHPPANLDAVSPPEARPGATMRERMEEHTNNPRLQRLPQAVRPRRPRAWRTTTATASGERTKMASRSTPPAGCWTSDFDGPAGLARLLGESAAGVRLSGGAVVPLHLRARPAAHDDCTLEQLKTAFMRDGRSLQALLQATVETDAFRTRTATVGGGPVSAAPAPPGVPAWRRRARMIGLPWLEAMTARPARGASPGTMLAAPLRRVLHPQRPPAVVVPRARRRGEPAGHAHPAAADPAPRPAAGDGGHRLSCPRSAWGTSASDRC